MKNKDIYITHDQKFFERLSYKARQKMYARLSKLITLDELDSVLDVGVTCNQQRLESNYFEKFFPYADRITALSDQDAGFLEEMYAGLKFHRGDACAMSFEDNAFDLVFSSAVIEHVGSYENQKNMLGEMYRVSKKYVYLTTPNRYYPIEVHTLLPLLHWFPKPCHRFLLKTLGKKHMAQESVLNLCSKRDIRKMCRELGIKNYRIYNNKCFGFNSNIMLFIEKDK
ncbi:MAG: class I SAM-dependent methyltransferase [Lactobacillales bacterium]|jgi:predicted SAM-dependent methyltransferase|nr:class I SAM-dependent methyltransferase [Lactobacillales bacterium]